MSLTRKIAPTLVGAGVVVALLLTANPLKAQNYFGRNKVQYETFSWQKLSAEHFDVYFYPAEEEVVRDASRMAERWYTRHSALLSHTFQRFPLIFYADHPDFQQTNVISGQLTEGTGGVTEGLRTRGHHAIHRVVRGQRSRARP